MQGQPVAPSHPERSRTEAGQLLQALDKHSRPKPAHPGDAGALPYLPFSFQSKSQQLAFIKSNETLLTPVPWPATGVRENSWLLQKLGQG